MTCLSTAHKRKRGSTLYRIVENDLATIVRTEWKISLALRIL